MVNTSCRDKGSFAWQGSLIDSCNGSAISGASLRVKTSGADVSTTSNADGSFYITGNWNEPCPLGNCKAVPPELNITFTAGNGDSRIIVLYPPTGRLDFGDLVLLDTLEIPIAFTGDTAGCANCELRIYLNQDAVFPFPNFGESIFLSQLPGTITFSRPVAYVQGGNEPAFPMTLSYTFRKNNEPAVRYPEIDLTGGIARCQPIDTVYLGL